MFDPTEDSAGGTFQGQAATQLFPMSSSSPSHPSLSASMAQRSALQMQPPPSGAMGASGVPTPNPSFGGVPLQEPTHTLATSGGRKTAVLVAAAVFAVGLGATAFVVSRTGQTTGAGNVDSKQVETPAEPKPAPEPTPAATPDVPSAAPVVSAEPAASSSAPPVVPSSAPTPGDAPKVPLPRGPAKPKKDFGY